MMGFSKIKRSWSFLTFLFIVSCPSAVFAAIIHVPGDQPTIQAGIDAASGGDTVLVADGTYTGTGNKDLDFNGKAITVQSENGHESCIIDCVAEGRAFYFHSGEGEDSVLSGFTLTNGRVGTYSEDGGGAILCEGSSPTIINCSFSRNGAFNGGAIYNSGDHLTITNCIFSNWADNDGGAIYNSGDHLTITNCIFSNAAHQACGGAICSSGGSLTITDSSFSDNFATGIGAIYNSGGSLTITNCSFSEHEADGDGGAIGNSYATSVTITNCIFSGARAADTGGAISNFNSDDQLTITNCSFSENYAPHGGAIFNDASNPTITNCTFSGNEASWGGAIYNFDSSPIISSVPTLIE
jgi:hypothetical protein